MFFRSVFKIKFKLLFFCFRRVLISLPLFISLVVQKSQIRKFSVFSVVVSLFLISCFFPSPREAGFFGGEGVDSSPPPIERFEPKYPDPVKQKECRKRGRNDCEGDKDCEKICDDIFSRRADRQDCYEYSSEMVFEFEALISATEDGDVDEIEDIGSNVLECMLDIDEREFAEAVRKMSRREAEEFIFLIANNEDFAEVLEEEDDEFNILKQLLNEWARSSDLESALSRELSQEDKTLLWLFAEYSEAAWDWLDGYVDEECSGRNTGECPGGENIGAYCNALLESGFSRSDWEDFLSDAVFFADEYEEEVEDESYRYEITNDPGRGYDGDFRDYCEMKAPSSNSNPPTNPPANPPLPNPPPPTGPDEAAVCGRTDAVKRALERRFSKDCDDVTHADLRSLSGAENLTISGNSVTSLQEGDFAGLTNLGHLIITGTRLTTLPLNVFNGLDTISSINLYNNNQFNSLPEDIFQPVRRLLAAITIQNTQLTTLPEDLFDGMTNLEFLYLDNNQFTSLPVNLFDGLSLLTSVFLSGNNFDPARQGFWERELGEKLKGGW